MMEIILDGAMMTDRASLHDQLAEKFAFSDYYGRNLDALYDMLSTYQKRVDVTVIHEEELVQNLGKYGNAFLRTLQDASASNENVKFTILSGKNENNT